MFVALLSCGTLPLQTGFSTVLRSTPVHFHALFCLSSSEEGRTRWKVRAARAEEHNTRSPEQLCELRAGRGAQTRRGAVPRCARGRTRGGSTLTLTTVTALHLLLPSLPCQPGTASGNTYV